MSKKKKKGKKDEDDESDDSGSSSSDNSKKSDAGVATTAAGDNLKSPCSNMMRLNVLSNFGSGANSPAAISDEEQNSWEESMSDSEGSDNNYYDEEDYDEEVNPDPAKEGDAAALDGQDPTVEQPGAEAEGETKDVDPD